ncbi:MAG: hypothetical protein QOJ98_729 [Acidobacteriota bacterium]|jgi:amino acid transporter|nr:hypothetical protein [Acidobacteriota bacterium]
MTTLARRLNAFDATMLVMGGIIGSGIFTNPHLVARHHVLRFARICVAC